MAGDGKVTIDIVLNNGQAVKGVADLSKAFDRINPPTQKSDGFLSSVMKISSGIGVTKLLGKAFGMVSNSIDGAISRVDTLNNFPKVMKNLGFSAKESKVSIDSLSKGIQGLPTSLPDIVSVTQELASMNGDLAGSTKTALALNDAFLASGSSSSDASRGLLQYQQMLSSGKVDLMSWRTLQETMPYALNETAKAFGFTGKAAKNDLYDALKKGTITMDQLNQKFVELDGGTKGFAKTARTATGGIATGFTNMKTAIVRGLANVISAFDEMIAKVTGNGIAQWLSTFGSLFENTFNQIAGVVTKLTPSFKALFTLFSGGAGTVMAVAGNFATLDKTMGSMTSGEKVTQVFSDIIAQFSNLPKMIAKKLPAILTTGIGVVGSLVQGILNSLPKLVQLGANIILQLVTAIGSAIPTLLTTGTTIITEFITAITTALPKLLKTGAQIIKQIVQSITQALPELVAGATTIMDSLVSAISANTVLIAKSAVSILNALIGGITKNLPVLIDGSIKIVNGLVDAIINNLPILINAGISMINALTNALIVNLPLLIDGAIQILMALVNGLIDNLPLLLQGAVALVQGLVAAIIQNLPLLIDGAIILIEALVGGIIQNLPAIIEAGIKMISALADGLIHATPQIIRGIFQLITSLLGAIVKHLPDLIMAGVQLIVSLAEGLVNSIGAVISATAEIIGQIIGDLGKVDLLQIGKDIIQGLIDGISSMIRKIGDVIGNIGKKITGGLTSFLKIGSPSRVMRQFGMWTGEGLVIGMNNTLGSIAQASKNMAKKALMNPVDIPVTTSGLSALENGQITAENALGLSGKILPTGSIINNYNSSTVNNQDGKQVLVETHVEIDSDQIIKHTAPGMEKAINKQQIYNERLGGILA